MDPVVAFLTVITFFVVIATCVIIGIHEEELREIKRLLRKLAGEQEEKRGWFDNHFPTPSARLGCKLTLVLLVIASVLFYLRYFR